jgi:ankyrin repeat protein
MRWHIAFIGLVIASLAAAVTPLLAQQGPPAGREMLAAARRGDLAAVQALVAGGAPLDPRDDTQQTPLLLAVQGDHTPVAAWLIGAGADINAQARNQDTPWLLAGALGRAEVLQLMIPRKPDLSIRNRFGGNALIPACERAHVEAVKVLLTTAININHVNNLGWTCLLEIVILGNGGPRHVDVTRMVLAAGADPNIADKQGVSPLAHARSKGQTEIARMIAVAGGK